MALFEAETEYILTIFETKKVLQIWQVSQETPYFSRLFIYSKSNAA
jgi:hypothetical protein